MSKIYFYIPNLIDYFRFITLFIAIFTYKDSPIVFSVFYSVSMFLDLFDGMAARHFKQFSRFGAALDMISDRLTTASLLMILGQFYPNYFLVFLLLVLLDVGSHWLQVYSALLVIAENKNIKNHKEVKEKFLILDIYYHNKYVLFNTCLFAELFLIMAYLNNFYSSLLMINQLWLGLFYFCFAVYLFKQIASIFQIFGACDRIVELDELELSKKEDK